MDGRLHLKSGLLTVAAFLTAAASFVLFLKADDWCADPCSASTVARDYGDIIGAVATLAAGLLAWFAVQRQMSRGEKLARRHETETEELVGEFLREKFDTIGVIWEELDLACTGADLPLRRRHANRVHVMLNNLPTERDWVDLESLSLGLGPRARRRLSRIVTMWKIIDRERKGIEQTAQPGGPPPTDPLHLMELLRIQFSHLERYAHAYDPLLAMIFADRSKVPVNHEPMAEHLRRFRAMPFPGAE